jgi:uridylate kinase
LGNKIRAEPERKSLTKTPPKYKFQRLILKISGEMLGHGSEQFHRPAISYVVRQIADVHRSGVRIGVVVGGGNIIRGKASDWLDRVSADFCGMTATVINGIVLQDFLDTAGIKTRLSGGFEIRGLVDYFNLAKDRAFYDEGGVLIFVAGTGNPLFTTDTAAALRAVEMKADLLIKATKVEGVYSADPRENKHAVFFPELDYETAIRKNLKIMDRAAFGICQEARIPICVYNLAGHRLLDILKGKRIGTLVRKGG